MARLNAGVQIGGLLQLPEEQKPGQSSLRDPRIIPIPTSSRVTCVEQ